MENVVRTKHKSCVAAACIYLACRLEGFPRLLDEVCIGCEEDINRMTKFQSKISAHLALPLSRITCADIVNRLGKKLRLSHPVVECAYEMCRKSVEYDLCESATPQAIAAAALLWANLVDQLRRTSVVSLTREDVRAVVQQCYSGEKAVDTVYKAFRRCIHMLLPDDWTISNDLLNAAPGGLESFPLQKDIDSKATSSTNVGQDGRTPQYIIRTPKGLKRMQSSAPTEDEPESLAKAPRLCM